MTNYKTTLDEIILDIRKAESGQRDAYNTNNPQGVREHHLAQFDRCKQAILQWVSDEVVGGRDIAPSSKFNDAMDIVYKKQERAITRNSLRDEQLAILKQHGWEEES